MFRILPCASPGLERRGDFDVAITRLLPSRFVRGAHRSPERGLITGSVAIAFGARATHERHFGVASVERPLEPSK
jgi:hypothetical protein